jgi:hypothetical protein
MIRLVSVLPFDLGFSLKAGDWPKSLSSLVALPTEELLGAEWQHARVEGTAADVYLHPFGFGAVVSELWCSDDELLPKTFALALTVRRKLHCDAIAGILPESTLIIKIRNAFQSGRRIERKRPTCFWMNCPYVLSIFAVDGVDQEGSLVGLAALAEPSLVQAEDTPLLCRDLDPEVIACRIVAIPPQTVQHTLVDHDISEDGSVYITWASIVIASKHKSVVDSTLREIIPLQVRLQTAWTMTHYVNKWKHTALRGAVNASRVNAIKWDLVRIHQTTEQLIDASIATRLKNLYEKFIATSGLAEESAKAEKGVALASDYADYMNQRDERKYRVVVEVCLFLFGACQVIPLLFDVPLVRLHREWLTPMAMVFLAIVIVRYVKAR